MAYLYGCCIFVVENLPKPQRCSFPRLGRHSRRVRSVFVLEMSCISYNHSLFPKLILIFRTWHRHLDPREIVLRFQRTSLFRCFAQFARTHHASPMSPIYSHTLLPKVTYIMKPKPSSKRIKILQHRSPCSNMSDGTRTTASKHYSLKE